MVFRDSKKTLEENQIIETMDNILKGLEKIGAIRRQQNMVLLTGGLRIYRESYNSRIIRKTVKKYLFQIMNIIVVQML